MKRAIIESPFKGANMDERKENENYARACCAHAVKLGFVPFASHLFFPQFLNEDDSEQRKLGIEMGYDFWDKADVLLFYIDRGMSPGMQAALSKAFIEGRPVRKMSIKADVSSPQTAGTRLATPPEVQAFVKRPAPVDLDALAETLQANQQPKA